MLLLAIDASTPTGSAALWRDDGLAALITASVDMTHSEGLMPAVDLLLRHARCGVEDLTAVACISGPGSYTGLRIGIATAQALAFARNLPCAAVSSLETLSWALPYASHPLCPLLPARKGWSYAQFFQWNGTKPEAISEELNIQPDELVSHIHQPAIFYGPGLPACREQLRHMLGEDYLEPPQAFHQPRADLLAEIAVHRLMEGKGVAPQELQPHYLGPSQAEINWKKRYPHGRPPL
ncbi:MAG: tRNA (adenosine(37)-N6)-threonylcarbamoyltransferase complex dimerization subunit type 1 TsaB [Candidatus Omnitrophota bacterium]